MKLNQDQKLKVFFVIQLKLDNRKVLTVSKQFKQIAMFDARLRMHMSNLPMFPTKSKTSLSARESFASLNRSALKKEPQQLVDELQQYFEQLMKSSATISQNYLLRAFFLTDVASAEEANPEPLRVPANELCDQLFSVNSLIDFEKNFEVAGDFSDFNLKF